MKTRRSDSPLNALPVDRKLYPWGGVKAAGTIWGGVVTGQELQGHLVEVRELSPNRDSVKIDTFADTFEVTRDEGGWLRVAELPSQAFLTMDQVVAGMVSAFGEDGGEPGTQRHHYDVAGHHVTVDYPGEGELLIQIESKGESIPLGASKTIWGYWTPLFPLREFASVEELVQTYLHRMKTQ
jgi:hypothetical protein